MLKKGTNAPDFSLKNEKGEAISLKSLLGNGPIVVYFYPKNETYGCVKEACAFRDSYEDFQTAGAEVVGMSRDSENSHDKFKSSRKLPFILLSDPEGKVHEAYDCTAGLLGLIMPRITYVIDQNGVIRDAFESNIKFEAHVENALEVVRNLQKTSEKAE